MKKRILISSVLTIVLCFSLIVGSTFALFTAEDKFNITVTSGNVEIDANVTALEIYSAVAVATEAEGTLLDASGRKFKYDEFWYTHGGNRGYADNNGVLTGSFANGGTVEYDGALDLSLITPGDKVVLNVAVDDLDTNVAIQYRCKVIPVDDQGNELQDFTHWPLGNVMVVTVAGEVCDFVAGEGCVSDWAPLDANGQGNVAVSIELPVWVGNDYQNMKIHYAVIVEAVQHNGVQ